MKKIIYYVESEDQFDALGKYQGAEVTVWQRSYPNDPMVMTMRLGDTCNLNLANVCDGRSAEPLTIEPSVKGPQGLWFWLKSRGQRFLRRFGLGR